MRCETRLRVIFSLPVLLVTFVAAISMSACTSVSQITNLTDPSCQSTLAKELASVLVGQGETPEIADVLARRTLTSLTAIDLGPRPFLVSSSSGADYSFFVERKKSGCILRLYGRQRGFVRYTNNLTYIDSRPLQGCSCRE